MENIKREFRKWQKDHPNIMTPDIVRLDVLDAKTLVELSQGTDFNKNKIYGVSLFAKADNGFRHTEFQNARWNPNRMFYNFHEAEVQISTIKDHVKACKEGKKTIGCEMEEK